MHRQIPLILALQNLPALQPLMQLFTWLGNEEFFLLMIPFVYLCIDRRLGARLGFVVLACDALAFLLKMFFHLPRPYWVDTRVQVAQAFRDTSYGLPSSHAQVGTATWFLVASRVRRNWMWIGTAVIVFLISLSRVYLGVHFPTDIVGGWLIGAVFLFAFLRLEKPVCERLQKISWQNQIVLALGGALCIFLLGFILRQLLFSTQDPASWAAFTQNEARSLAALAARTGGLFGLGAGLAMMHQWARFDAGGAIGLRAVRFVIAVAGLLALRVGLSAIFPKSPEATDWFFRFLRYALMTFWVAFGAPLLFLKLRLAQPYQIAQRDQVAVSTS